MKFKLILDPLAEESVTVVARAPSELTRQIEALEGEVSDVQSDYTELCDEHSDLQDKHSDLQSEYTELHTDHKELVADMDGIDRIHLPLGEWILSSLPSWPRHSSYVIPFRSLL